MARVEWKGRIGPIELLSLNGVVVKITFADLLVCAGSDLLVEIDRGSLCHITIEQLDPDKSPEAVAERVVERHRGALDILEENDAGTWVPPKALVVFGKDIEAARAILRADCEAHGGVWDESWFARPPWMPKSQSEPDMKEGHDG